MDAIHHLDLQSAHWRRVRDTGYPILELKINGYYAYVFEPDRREIDNDFIHLTNFGSGPELKVILPEIVLDERVAKATGLDTRVKSATNDPRIVKLAKDFWYAVNTFGVFVPDKKVYPVGDE
jgi:hypothetical protein